MLYILPQNWKAEVKIAEILNYVMRLQKQKALWSSVSAFFLHENQMQPANKTNLLNQLLDYAMLRYPITVLLFAFKIGIKLSSYIPQKSCEAVHRKQSLIKFFLVNIIVQLFGLSCISQSYYERTNFLY